MDDEQYRQARAAIDLPPCVYGKALQYGYYACQHAQVISLGERDVMHCGHAQANRYCREFYVLSLSKSGFALGTSNLPVHLTFNKAMKVQIGGLNGAMQRMLALSSGASHETGADKRDVAACFEQLKSSVQDFSELDFSKIVTCIQHFSPRKRS